MTRRVARTLLPLAFVLSTAVALTAWLVWPKTASAALPSASASATSVPSALVVTTLHRVGLDPAALTAAGVDEDDAAVVVTAVKGHLEQAPTGITGADTSYAAARVAHDSLRRIVQSGLATEQQKTDFAAAVQTLATTTTARAAALDAAYNAGVAELSVAQKGVLAAIRTNRSWQLPVEYATVNRSQAEWVALRDALSDKNYCAVEGGQISGGSQTLLATVEADPKVSGAKTGLAEDLAAVTASWNQATAP